MAQSLLAVVVGANTHNCCRWGAVRAIYTRAAGEWQSPDASRVDRSIVCWYRFTTRLYTRLFLCRKYDDLVSIIVSFVLKRVPKVFVSCRNITVLALMGETLCVREGCLLHF